TAVAATKTTKPSAGSSAIGFPGGVGASDFGERRYSHHPATAPTAIAGKTINVNGTRILVARMPTRNSTRTYMTAVASAIPAGSAPAILPVPSRWASDCVTAVEL